MTCEGCKENAAALGDIRRELAIANERLARLLKHLEVPPAPVGDGGGVMDILRKAPPGQRPG